MFISAFFRWQFYLDMFTSSTETFVIRQVQKYEPYELWHEIVILNIKGFSRKPLTNEDEANQENYFTFNQFLYFP